MENISRCSRYSIGRSFISGSFHVREFVDAVGIFTRIFPRSIHASLPFLAYRYSAEVDYQDVPFPAYLFYKSSNGDVLTLPKRQATGKKPKREKVLVTEAIFQVYITYEASERMSLIKKQWAARLASIEDHCDEDNGPGVDSDENHNEPPQETAKFFHDKQYSGRRGTPVLQAIRDFYTKFSFKKPARFVEAPLIIEDGISSIPTLFDLMDQHSEAKRTCFAHNKEHAAEVIRFNDLASQRIPLEQKTDQTLAKFLHAIVRLAKLLQRAREKVCKVP